MRSFIRLACLVTLLLAGCGRSPESLISRQVAILEETAKTLATVTDEASAEAAGPKLGGLQQELNSLVPRVKKLNLTVADKKKLEDQHRDAMNRALEKYQTELARVRNLHLTVGGLSELDEAIAE
jgi:hypothetical protein